ncbi:hypothetical protein EV646_112190 [Kribbella antiqua]|uniref:Phage integrase family protein n=1 Tax=Kribbella antiqua TaxID=2512217 RepID=A0A4R2IFY2_9ACTN|nr:hypothetical protein [Kribbella antiqua]TCO43613.1 hypothetical protein EV646_112190 [Kribbella antiqua]
MPDDPNAVTSRQIADQLGHSRVSMTQDGYLGRKVKNLEAARAMDAVFGRGDAERGWETQSGG